MTTLKLTGTDGQADRQTGGQTDRQDHVLSQADALTKNDKSCDTSYKQIQSVQKTSSTLKETFLERSEKNLRTLKCPDYPKLVIVSAFLDHI